MMTTPPPSVASVIRTALLVLILLHGLYVANTMLGSMEPPSSSSLSSSEEEEEENSQREMLASNHHNPNNSTTSTTINTIDPHLLYSSSYSSSSSLSSSRHPLETGFIPLLDLVQTSSTSSSSSSSLVGSGNISCPIPEAMERIEDTILPESITHDQRKIPRVIHITGKIRCAITEFRTIVNQWRDIGNHTVVFHDEVAMDRLLYDKDWPEFPHLKLVLRNCLLSGASKADLWRYLVLWEYGGIYTDSDTAPGRLFTQSTISPTDDAWFVPEKLGILTQYFLSASPRHPLMYLAVMETLHRLLGVDSVLNQYIPAITGPGALKVAMMDFMQVDKNGVHPLYGRIQAGLYVGMGNRTVTVVGTKQTSKDYIQRNALRKYIKFKGYKWTNQTHFSLIKQEMSNETQQLLDVNCFERLHHMTFRNREYDDTVVKPFQAYYIPKP